MKTETKYTPGPWVVEKQRVPFTTIDLISIVAADPEASPESGYKSVPAHLKVDVATAGAGRTEANAKLIAAAPDLLSALQKVRAAILDRADVIDGSEGPRPNLAMDIQSEVFDLIDSAILKAGGSHG